MNPEQLAETCFSTSQRVLRQVELKDESLAGLYIERLMNVNTQYKKQLIISGDIDN